MKKIFFILALVITAGQKTSAAQQPDSVRNFIEKALTTMQKNSVFSKNVDWNVMRVKVLEMSKNAMTYKEAAPAIKHAFDALNDKHGWLVFGDEEYRNPKFHNDTSRLTENIKKASMKGPQIYAAMLKNKYAYLSIPFFGGQSAEAMSKFSQRIQDSLYKLVDESTEGVIIDLRLNGGGNMFPMFAGLSNLLGSGDVSISSDSAGNIIDRTSIQKNDIVQNGNIITSLTKSYGDFSRLPVAVIIGPATGSAGECLAAGFIGRKNTRLIGEATAGYTSTNDGFLLAGQDYGMVLAVGYLTDRFGKAYYENVTPDIEVVGGDEFFNHENDQKIKAAMIWLDEQK